MLRVHKTSSPSHCFEVRSFIIGLIPNHPAPLGYSPEDEVNLPRIAWSTNLYLYLYLYLFLYFYLNLYLYLYVYLYFCLYLTHSSAFDLAQGNTTMKSTTQRGRPLALSLPLPKYFLCSFIFSLVTKTCTFAFNFNFNTFNFICTSTLP